MTKTSYIEWLERMILGCDELGMEREKSIYQTCLKKARSLEMNPSSLNKTVGGTQVNVEYCRYCWERPMNCKCE